MAKPKQSKHHDLRQNSDLLIAQERIKIRHKIFQVIAYKLDNGQTAVTTYQMVAAVRKSAKTLEKYITGSGVLSVKVVLPNHVVTDVVPILNVIGFWKYLNDSGQGNALTQLGQETLESLCTRSSVSCT